MRACTALARRLVAAGARTGAPAEAVAGARLLPGTGAAAACRQLSTPPLAPSAALSPLARPRQQLGGSWAAQPACAAAALLQPASGARHASGGNTAPKQGVMAPAKTMGFGGARPMQIPLTSPNKVYEPYSGPGPRLQVGDFLSQAGVKAVWQRLLGKVKNVYTLAKVKKDVPGWTLSGFKQQAQRMYGEISGAMAAGDRGALRPVCTEAVQVELKKQLRDRDASGWDRVDWRLVRINSCSVVQGRLAVPAGADKRIVFAQFTVEINSVQRFAAYDAKGKVISGDADRDLPVREFWVFERSLIREMPNKAWRLAGRLSVPVAR